MYLFNHYSWSGKREGFQIFKKHELGLIRLYRRSEKSVKLAFLMKVQKWVACVTFRRVERNEKSKFFRKVGIAVTFLLLLKKRQGVKKFKFFRRGKIR